MREFLKQWYDEQNIDGLMVFVAKDNQVRFFTAEGALPKGAVVSRWLDIFYSAFSDGAGSVHFETLSDAISYTEPAYPKATPHLFYLNEDRTRDRFAIIAPKPPADTMYFPSDKLPREQLDMATKYLRHLKEEYVRIDPNQNRLQLVAYRTTGHGLVNEGCVLYWIKEDGAWKLAAFQGTD